MTDFVQSPLLSAALSDEGVFSLLEILKISDEEAYEHSVQVANLTALVLEEMNKESTPEFSAEAEIEIVKGALLADIGKAFLPFGIQHSGVKLDSYLLEVVKMHSVLGYIAIRNGIFSEIVKNIVLYHHACANGSGYPHNIETREPVTEGNAPTYIWVVAYADRFEAMTGERKFKSSLSYAQAWDELNRSRREGILPYKYAKYFHTVIKKLDIFGEG